MGERPLAVDLFTGRGGWARGLLAAGFRVVGFDILPKPKDYPAGAEYVQADVRQVDGARFRGAAVVVASPPCTGFSLARMMNPNADERPNAEDFELVLHAVRIIREAQPRFWAIENVRGALRWFEPMLGAPAFRSDPLYVWGRFPGFLVEHSDRLKWKTGPIGTARNGRGREGRVHRSPALRAEIPAALAEPFARACWNALEVPA